MSGSDGAPSQALMQAALQYACEGFRVFPCRVGEKLPAGRWKEGATTDPLQIVQWWTEEPGANILVACGKGSGVTVLDLDTKLQPDGASHYAGEALAVELLGVDWKQRYRYTTTPSGGYHVWFPYQEEWGNGELKLRGVKAGSVQNDGAYVVVWPSRTGEGPYLETHQHLLRLNGVDEGLSLRLLSLRQQPGEVRKAGGGGGGGAEPVPAWQEAELPTGLSGLPPKVQAAMADGDWSAWGDDRSAGIMGCAAALWGMKLDGAQVLAALMSCHPTLQVGWDRRASYEGAAAWLWQYVVLPAKPPTGEDVFNLVERTLRGATGLVEYTEVVKRAAMDAAENDLGPTERDLLVDKLHDGTGIRVKTIREEFTLAKKQVAEERRVAARAKKLSPDQDYVYVEGVGSFWGLSEPGWYTRTAVKDFNRWKDDDLRDALEVMPRVKKVSYRPFNQWAPGYDPESARWNFNEHTVRNELNLWQESPMAPRLDAVEGDVEPWLELLHETMKVRSEEARHLLDFFACSLQFPQVKVNHLVLLGGDPGIGKDTLIQPVLKGFGAYNHLQVPGAEAVVGSFDHPGFTHSSFMVLQELRTRGNWRDAQAAYDALKNKLASPPNEIPVNLKNVQQYMVPNIINVFAMTNHRDAVELEQDDRRMYMVWAEGRQTMGPAYWNRLNTWMERGGNEAVVGWLLQRDLSGFNPSRVPGGTEWKEEARHDSLSPVAQTVKKLVSARVGAMAKEVVSAEEVLGAVQAELMGQVHVTPNAVGSAMKRLRVKSRRAQEGRGGHKNTYYLLRNEAHWLDVSPSALAEAADSSWDWLR